MKFTAVHVAHQPARDGGRRADRVRLQLEPAVPASREDRLTRGVHSRPLCGSKRELTPQLACVGLVDNVVPIGIGLIFVAVPR